MIPVKTVTFLIYLEVDLPNAAQEYLTPALGQRFVKR